MGKFMIIIKIKTNVVDKPKFNYKDKKHYF